MTATATLASCHTWVLPRPSADGPVQWEAALVASQLQWPPSNAATETTNFYLSHTLSFWQYSEGKSGADNTGFAGGRDYWQMKINGRNQAMKANANVIHKQQMTCIHKIKVPLYSVINTHKVSNQMTEIRHFKH